MSLAPKAERVIHPISIQPVKNFGHGRRSNLVNKALQLTKRANRSQSISYSVMQSPSALFALNAGGIGGQMNNQNLNIQQLLLNYCRNLFLNS